MKANVKILEIMESGVKNAEEMQCLTEMAESAISKKFEDCYVFRLSNSGKITFFVNETEMNFDNKFVNEPEIILDNKNIQPKKVVKIKKTSEIQPVVFSYADESDKEYLKSLNLTTFDGKTILSKQFGDKMKVLCDKKSKAYFFKIGIGAFPDVKTMRERQSFLKEKYKSDLGVVEYMLICGDIRAYIFTKELHHQEGVTVKVLEIMQSGGNNEFVSSLLESAFAKTFSYCPEFRIS